MPTYEYECKKCGATMDVFQSITAKPLLKHRCEKCDEVRPVRRLIGTGGAVLFKGSGFYQTDYRSSGYKEKAKSETESARPAADKTETKSPTPETPKPAKSDTPKKPKKS